MGDRNRADRLRHTVPAPGDPPPAWRHRALTCAGVLLALLAAPPRLCAGAASGSGPPEKTHHASVPSGVYPWSSLAKLFNSVGGSCTAAVIARDRVLTAAHCVYAFRTRRFLPPDALHVLVGYDRGGYRTHARVKSYRLGPGYDPAAERQTAASDWVVLDLVEPLRPDIRPLRIEPAPDDGAVLLAGFARDRAYVVTADEDCRITGRLDQGRMIAHDCLIQPGDSGAPLLRQAGAEASIVGIAIGIWHLDRGSVGVAAPVPTDLSGP